MGCGITKEKLQTEMLVLQLEKAEIQEERERLINQLKLLSYKENYTDNNTIRDSSKKDSVRTFPESSNTNN